MNSLHICEFFEFLTLWESAKASKKVFSVGIYEIIMLVHWSVFLLIFVSETKIPKVSEVEVSRNTEVSSTKLRG